MTSANDHPLASRGVGITQAALWFGVEVEGRLHAGKRTAFVSRELDPEQLAKLHARLSNGDVQQVFVTEAVSDLDWVLVLARGVVRGRAPVTLARLFDGVEAALDHACAIYVGLFVRATNDAPWAHRLRSYDQVSVGVPYTIVSWDVGDGVRTRPSDYEKDTL